MFVDFIMDKLFWWLRALAERDIELLGLAFFAILAVTSELTYWIGRFTLARWGDAGKTSVGFVTGGMLALLAFFLGISLSMADARNEARRQTLLDEANAIGTVWLRTQQVPGVEGEELRRLVRDYAMVRHALIRSMSIVSDDPALETRSTALQSRIWTLADEFANRAPTPVNALLLVSLNQAFDIALANRRNYTTSVPNHVLRLLFIASVFSVGAMGYGFGLGGRRHFVVTVLLLLLWTLSSVLILDLDHPSTGRIRLDDRPLVWTLEGMGLPPAR